MGCAKAFSECDATDAEARFGELILAAAAAATEKGVDAEKAAQHGCDNFADEYRKQERDT